MRAYAVADLVGSKGAMLPLPLPGPDKKWVIKTMTAEGGRINFMFLSPAPYPAAGSATGMKNILLYSSTIYNATSGESRISQRERAPTSERECANLLFCKRLLKTAWKNERIWT